MGTKLEWNNGLGQNLENRTKTKIVDMVFGEKEEKIRESNHQFLEIPLELIAPRPTNSFIQSNIDKLKESIRLTNNRLINPITVVAINSLGIDHPLLVEARERGISLEGKKYIISAGERRYRAFLQLYEEDQAEISKMTFPRENQFATITANVLNVSESLKETSFYVDSNTNSRQLTPLEALQHFDLINKSIISEENQSAAMTEMYGQDWMMKTTAAGKPLKFNRYDYILFALENQYGFTGWSRKTIQNYCSFLQTASPELLQDVYSQNISIKDAMASTGKKTDEKDTENVSRETAAERKKKAAHQSRIIIRRCQREAAAALAELNEVMPKMSGPDRKKAQQYCKLLNELQAKSKAKGL